MLLNHEQYQSSFDIAMACAVECEHCAEACMGQPEMIEVRSHVSRHERELPYAGNLHGAGFLLHRTSG